jgi:DNA-binding NarL/FixJ family response regulator
MARTASPTFVGRVAEQAALDDALDQAARGHTTTVLIAGDAGIGKTRLLQTWSEQARGRGALIATGSCLDLGETGPAYTPVVEALRELFRELGPEEEETLVGADRSVLARLVPELGRPPEIVVVDQPGSTFAQTRLFDRVVDVLQRASATSPVVLVIEDLHWADQSTQAFLLYLVEVARDLNVLVIGTYRPEAADGDPAFRSTLAQLLRRPRVATLPLAPFGEDELREQLTGILGVPPGPALLTAIHVRSEGNALFAEELAAAPDPTADLPASVAAATAVRVEGLSDDARTVLRVASVIGRTAEYGVLRVVAGLDDESLARALRESVKARLLESLHVGEAFRFRHALLQDAIYDETLPGERRRLHAAVATALSNDPDQPRVDPELAPRLARHWYEARDFPRAFLASGAAAAAAEQQSAFAEAATHYERMLQLWGASSGASSISRAGLLERAAWNAFLGGDLERSAAHGRAALAELETAPDDSLRIRVLDRLTWALSRLGDDAWPFVRMLAAIDPAGRPMADQVLIEMHRTSVLGVDGDWGEARRRATLLVDRVRVGDDLYLYAEAASNLSKMLLSAYDFDAALALLRPLREAAAEAGDDFTVASTDIDICDVLRESQRWEELLIAAVSAIESAGRAGLGRWARPNLRFAMALSHFEGSRLKECLEQVELVLADAPTGRVLATTELVAGLATISMGEYEEAARHLEASRMPDSNQYEELDRGWLATGRARLALAERRFDDVQRIVAATAPRVAGLDVYNPISRNAWLLAEVGLAAAAEQMDIARAADDHAAMESIAGLVPVLTGYVDQVRRRRDDSGMPVLGWMESYEGLIAAHVARILEGDDPSVWEAAAAKFPDRTVEHLTARYHQAEAMLTKRASRDQAREVMAPAHATAVDIGARPLAERFEELARRARIDLPSAPEVEAAPAPSEPVEAAASPGEAALRNRGLSSREIEVLTLVAAGFSNHQIAGRLFISDKTASVHVSHILDKLGVATRTEAATVGVRLGLPEVEAAQA